MALLIASSRAVGAADHCAPTPPPSAVSHGERGIGLAGSLEHANYSTERYAGNYTGVVVGVSYVSSVWDLLLEAPVYRLSRNGLDVGGPGDPFVRGRFRVWGAPHEEVTLGGALGLSLPLGDAASDLGMGHVMVHPGVWLRTTGEELRTEWTLGYGRVVAGGDHAHGTGPLVNPMNASELSAGGALVWNLFRVLDLRAAAMGAIPVASPGGEARATLGFGIRLVFGKLDLSSVASFPLVGDPFRDKVEVSVGYSL